MLGPIKSPVQIPWKTNMSVPFQLGKLSSPKVRPVPNRASGQGPTWTAAAVVAAAPWSPAQLDRSSVATYY